MGKRHSYLGLGKGGWWGGGVFFRLERGKSQSRVIDFFILFFPWHEVTAIIIFILMWSSTAASGKTSPVLWAGCSRLGSCAVFLGSLVTAPGPRLALPCDPCLALSPGVHTCFVCKSCGEDVKRCLLPLCGKYYHEACIQKYPPTVMQNKGFRCSLHICMTCHAANPANISASKGTRALQGGLGDAVSWFFFVSCPPGSPVLCGVAFVSLAQQWLCLLRSSCSQGSGRGGVRV